jgi:hypothetical protein
MKLTGQISPGAKNPIKINGWNHHREERKERPKKGQKTHSPQEPKERASPSRGRRLSHPQPL